jgi:peptidoglycan/LPS O-acetylase OafA/YrhL
MPRLAGGAVSRGIAFLARVSYPVFLLHYPVLLAVGALVHALWPGDALAAAAGLLLAWVASLLAGAALQRATEGG